MKKIVLASVLCALCLVPCVARAESVSYLDYDAVGGTFTNATAECTVVTGESVIFFEDGGWYVAKGTNTCSGITVNGAAHLVLADGATLTANTGILVCEGKSLTIYGQDEGSGKLIAKGMLNAGIGGGARSASCGAITINGGIVTATGYAGYAGIGGGAGGRDLSGASSAGGAGGRVTINGGTVLAWGGAGAAGIGGGAGGGLAGGASGDGGTLVVNGGWVTASRIGGGDAGGGGFSPVIPGHGIGPGTVASSGAGVTATFTGGVTEAQDGIFTKEAPTVSKSMEVQGAFNQSAYVIVARADDLQRRRDMIFHLGSHVVGITSDFTGKSIREGTKVTFKYAQIGTQFRISVACDEYWEYRGETMFTVETDGNEHELNATVKEILESAEYALPGESALYTIKSAQVVIPSLSTFTNGGWYVAKGAASCETITVSGSANLILADGAELTVDGGIRVTEGNSLTIYGQGEGTGKLIATGTEGCAGIGGGAGDKGADGYFFGKRGSNGASGGSCGVVAINGGVVAAIGGTGAAGIGGGAGGAGGSVGTFQVEGKTYTAGPDGFHGADGGSGGSGGTLTINGGTVTATGGNGAAGIGGGVGGIGSAGLQGGRDGWNGENGANTTATFLGGVTEALNGIFTAGEPILGENVEVMGEFNKAAYIKIEERSGPTCAGGAIEKVDGAWVVAPTNGATKVVITGLSEGETVAGVRLGEFVVPSGAFDGFGEDGKTFSISLDEAGEVTIGTETIPVQPTIGEGVENPFVISEKLVAVTVMSIPGLKYTLWREGKAALLGGTEGWTDRPASDVAGATTVKLVDSEPPKGQAFYRITVSVP